MPDDGLGGRGRPDPAAVAAALAVVPGVVQAWTTCDAAGVPVAVRLELEPGVDEVEVAAAAHRILRVQFGVGLDADRLQVIEVSRERLVPEPRLHLVEDAVGQVIELGGVAGALRAARRSEEGRYPTDVLASVVRHPAGAVSATVVDLAQGTWRLAVDDVTVTSEGASTSATVTLRRAGEVHTGSAEGGSGDASVLRTVAQATANGAAATLGPVGSLEVDTASLVPVGELEVVVVQVAWVTADGSERLLGAAEVRDDLHRTVIRATLDAVNRRLALAHHR